MKRCEKRVKALKIANIETRTVEARANKEFYNRSKINEAKELASIGYFPNNIGERQQKWTYDVDKR